MNRKVISYQGADESRYLRIRSAYASHAFREILEEDVDVLDRADEVLLDGDIPQATPSGVFHPEADAVSKIAFHDVLPRLNVAPRLYALRPGVHGVEDVLTNMTGYGPSVLVRGTRSPESALLADFTGSPVDEAIVMDGASVKLFLCGTGERVGGGIVGKILFLEDALSDSTGFLRLLERLYMGVDLRLMTGEEVLRCSVLAVRGDRVCLDQGILLMIVEQGEETMGFVDYAGGDLHGGDDLVGGIDHPVGLIAGSRFTMGADQRRIGIGRREMTAVYLRVGVFIEPTRELVVQRRDDGILRGIRIYQTRVDEDLCPIDEPRTHAPGNDALEEASESALPPSSPRLRQNTVVGDLRLNGEPQKPEPIEPLRERRHKLSFRTDVVKEEKEHELENHRRGNGNMTRCPVGVPHLGIDEIEVDELLDPTEGVVLPDPSFKLNIVGKEGIVRGRLLTHHRPYLLDISAIEVYHTPLETTRYLYATRDIVLHEKGITL